MYTRREMPPVEIKEIIHAQLWITQRAGIFLTSLKSRELTFRIGVANPEPWVIVSVMKK
jgi:hypothetical protein